MMMTPQTNYHDLAQDALFDALKQIFGLTETNANKMFRFSWPTQSGSEKFPAKPTVDVCYIRLTGYELPMVGYVNHNYSSSKDGGSERMDTHRGLRVQLIFYGPHSMEYATRARVGFDRDDAASVLRAANMSYVPNRQMPVSMDELIDGNWFSRTDVSLDFYQLIVYTGTVPLIESVPDIEITINS